MNTPDRCIGFLFLLAGCWLASPLLAQQDVYYPGGWGTWDTRTAAEAGFDPDRLEAVVQYARDNANQDSRDLAAVITESFSSEPHFSLIGPAKPRGDANGLIVRSGYIVAEWGDTDRVDMTFSVTKSYLSTVAGLALDKGLIRDLHDPVRLYVRDGTFEGEHNRDITWHHLLNQTSDWSGELWGKPDWADRPQIDDPENRDLRTPGTAYKYNDVRVNLLAYCLTQIFRQPLPRVLREHVMDPIGASPTWRWHGYENSWITIDGLRMQSVSGGGHWGGGMFISSRDHARFGLLFQRNGRWEDRQLISQEWIDALRQPTHVRKDYGYMWWLNTDQMRSSSAPENSITAAGFGGNYIYVDPDNDITMVLRWTPDIAGVIERVLGALNPGVSD